MIQAASRTPNKVKDMVSYYEKKGDQTLRTTSNRRRLSMTAMMNFTRRPWEHFPRRKSSSSTNPRRRSSTSTGSVSTTYEPAEENLADSFYAASERSGTSTVISEDRRRSANPDYDWEHDGEPDDIADLKASLHKIGLYGSDTTNELHKVDSAGVEDKSVGSAPPGVHEIDFVEVSAAQTAEDETGSKSTKEKILNHHELVTEVKFSHSETLKDEVDEGESATKSPALDSKASNNSDSPQQLPCPKVPTRKSSASGPSKIVQLRIKTSHYDKDGKSVDATSPSSPSPKSKARPKLALDLPGIPESEAETLGRQRRPQLSIIRQLPAQPQAVHVNRSSRPPVSMKRYPVRSISAPLPGQQQPPASPTQMMDLVNQRQVKFTNIREEKLGRLGSTNTARGSQGLMGRRHASAPVSKTAARRRSGMLPPGRPSLAQRFSLSRRKQSFSQAIRDDAIEALKCYHPILVGDKLGESGRFSVLRKLGYGTYGTVWMCWDAKVKKLRAVKVMQAETSAEDYKNEVGLLALLSKKGDVLGVEEAYKNHLAAPLEHIWQDGPNGRHICIVMPVLGPNVMKAKALGDVNYLKDVCSQVISGLAFLHSKGLAHGDLHPGNVLLQTTLNDLEVDDITPLLKKFNHEPLYAEGHDGPGPHAPKYIYENFYWAEVDPKYFKKEIAIIDFGTSFETSDPPDYPTIDMSLRAPEQFFGSSPSQASDLWALGCTMMHILGSNNPFSRQPVPSWEDALGPLPQPYRAKWIASKSAARKRKYDEMAEEEPVSLSSEQISEAKQCRLEESGTEDVILAFLSKPSTILVPINAQTKQQQQQQQQDQAENSDGSGGDDESERLLKYVCGYISRLQLYSRLQPFI
ncbi:hypothetical protein SLS63_011366 [Diaporthe eres]|uniref:Protein kinase domain-containing protein n=1 Tax=Diaporthe eres TaxID=83184 RepID=A0ABR1NU93_DIAER